VDESYGLSIVKVITKFKMDFGLWTKYQSNNGKYFQANQVPFTK
jgi:hypothetical protein